MSLTSRIQALTAYANEVTGESDTTLADAVATLAEGYGSGGEYNFAWADATVITIPANTVSNTQDAKTFLNASNNNIIFLLSDLTADNQIVYYVLGGSVGRYRNYYLQSTTAGSAYDATLVEGTQYLVLTKK